MKDRKIICPLIDEEVDEIECIENRDCIDGIIIETSMPDKYKKKEICNKCLYKNNVIL